MKPRRWPDVVIVVALVALAALGGYALWGEELGLRGKPGPTSPAPTRTETGAGA